MQAGEHYSVSVHVAAVVMPVAVYFLILGLLNTRRRPQVLTGRQDFAMLIVVLSPLIVIPAMDHLGASLRVVTLAAAAVVAAVLLLAPRGATWVVYNLPLPQARRAVAQTLERLGLHVVPKEGGFFLPEQGASVDIGGFPVLRNATIRFVGRVGGLSDRFEETFRQVLATTPAEPSAAAMALMLVATAMLVAPLAMVAQRVPEIVRILTGLLY